MRRKKHYFILTTMVLLVVAVVCSGCGKKLDELVFVKNLVCSSDMDAEISFVTNKKYERYVTDIEIPNMPDGMHVDFYGEEIEDWKKYDMHIVNFGVGAKELSDAGGLKEDFVFHEVIVKWNDGNTTSADIGTIHMTAGSDEAPMAPTGSVSEVIDSKCVRYEESYIAQADLQITGLQIPYFEMLPDAFSDVCVNDQLISDVSKSILIHVKKGESITVSYTMDETASNGYGRILLEAFLVGSTQNGLEFETPVIINGFQRSHRATIDWVEKEMEGE